MVIQLLTNESQYAVLYSKDTKVLLTDDMLKKTKQQIGQTNKHEKKDLEDFNRCTGG